MYFIINIYSLDITSFQINYFKEDSKLYYVNAMNNDNGDIYFEFWGENNAKRYFIGKSYPTEEPIKFNNGIEIFSIEANSITNYHESIIVNYGDKINIFSMSIDNFDFINLQNGTFSSAPTSNYNFQNIGDGAFRNCLLKLKDNTYFSSILLYIKKNCIIWSGCHKVNFEIFKFSSEDIDGYNRLSNKPKIIDQLNSTSCFQTESGYIQCFYSVIGSTSEQKTFSLGIYDTSMGEIKADIELGQLKVNTFAKIFHIKDEIGAYVFFDAENNDVPKIILRNLADSKKALEKINSNLDYINPNNNRAYTLDNGLFSSDAIKIDDSRFAIILTIKDTFDLLFCLFDFNEAYSGIRVRYYKLDLSSINVQISLNIRAFVFKEYFGFIFYDSYSQYPGYMFLNYINIKSDDKIDIRTIHLKLESAKTIFSFSENLAITNNIYSGQIKVKITNFPQNIPTGIIVKSLNLNSIISINDILNIDDSLVFEQINPNCILLGDFFLEFLPFVEEIDAATEFYGNYEQSDFENIGYFTKYPFIELSRDENQNICYNNYPELQNSNIFFNKCISNYPDDYNLHESSASIISEEKRTAEINNIGDSTNINNEIFQSTYSLNDIDYTTNKNEIKEKSTFIKDNINDPTNKNEIEEQTSYNINNFEYSTNKDEIKEQTSYNINNIEYSSNKDEIKEQTSFNTNNINYPTNKDEIKEQTSYNINNIEYSSNNYEIKEQTSYNINNINYSTNKYESTSINQDLNSYINKKNDECYIDIDLLINNYKLNDAILELKELKNCSIIYYCYSSNTDIYALITLNPDLIYINFNECKNLLVTENIIDTNTELLIIGKQQLNISMNFDYDIYIKNGTKLEDLSLCKNTKIEISSPINDIKAYEAAITLSEQGYDIFNLSSSFYYDFCLSVYINNSDVTLGVRQNDIRPEENSICLDGCIYNGVNLDTKRINCLCDTDNFKENKTSNNEYKEIVKENFFIYILDMINYRIVICFKLIKNFDNYFHNYGFYIGFGIYFIILVLFTIYLFKGNRVIKIKYLHYEPKIDEKDLLGIKSSKNNLIDCGNLKNNSKISSSRSNILSRKSFLFNEQKSKEDNQKNDYNNNKKYSMKYFPDNNTNNKQFKIKNKDNKRSSVRQKKSIKKVNRFKIEVNKENDSKSPPSSTNKNLENSEKGMNIKEEVKKEEQKNVDYNELNYSQAIIKDERSVIQIFISYFNSKLDIIQIIFYPQEFSHVSVSLSLYLYELLLDLTFNALLFSDDVISQKYYNNGDLLLITSNILSIVSNIISSFIVCLIEYLVNFQEVLEAAKEETNDEKSFYKIFIKIFKFITLKIRIFYLVVFISGILCEYYLFIFCTIFKKIQTNLFTNYIIGSLWSLGYKVVFCILTTILRKIALIKKFKRLFLIAKFIDEKF